MVVIPGLPGKIGVDFSGVFGDANFKTPNDRCQIFGLWSELIFGAAVRVAKSCDPNTRPTRRPDHRFMITAIIRFIDDNNTMDMVGHDDMGPQFHKRKMFGYFVPTRIGDVSDGG